MDVFWELSAPALLKQLFLLLSCAWRRIPSVAGRRLSLYGHSARASAAATEKIFTLRPQRDACCGHEVESRCPQKGFFLWPQQRREKPCCGHRASAAATKSRVLCGHSGMPAVATEGCSLALSLFFFLLLSPSPSPSPSSASPSTSSSSSSPPTPESPQPGRLASGLQLVIL